VSAWELDALTEKAEAAAIVVLDDDECEGLSAFDLGVRVASAVLVAAGVPDLLAEVERLQEVVKYLRGNPRDEYHTMTELYDYRMLYNAHAALGWLAAGIPVIKSHRHSDGEECFGGGWFIVTADLPTGQVSNHYRDEYWSLFEVPEVDLAPEWDGHTPQVAADRLRAALAQSDPPDLKLSPGGCSVDQEDK
jgi:hypothetical protein